MLGADQREAAGWCRLARPSLPFPPMRKRLLRIAAGASPGRAQRVNAERTDFAVRLGYRHRDGVRVDIQTNKSHFRHATNSFRMRLCAAVYPTHSVTRDTAN